MKEKEVVKKVVSLALLKEFNVYLDPRLCGPNRLAALECIK